MRDAGKGERGMRGHPRGNDNMVKPHDLLVPLG